MRFKEGDKVQFIENNELIIGTIKRVNNDVGWVDLKVSDLSWFFRKLEDVVKVKEPELIAVPRFAADWIKHCKQREYDLACLLDYEDSDMSAEMYEWLISSADNQELLARAWLDGYEVEKEPLYYVRLPLSTWNDDAAELEVINMYVLLNVQSDETSITGSIINENKEWRTKLTEAEIKGIPGGEIYWQFAVLVEEAEA
ncbi:DUF1642 domain-containing protein [Listeria monocytogenes]|jgi:Protein of unknown function (DUF1642).|uniref:Lmo2315 protein n=3 Tax=Listeria monocytogenes TaxID=1639 RepID=Q8Y4W4_LISMO|nr:DUF1642 domain-containing protein [Listeria monocytogenes]NP_465839.1 hypothetical protein lmo2315 [Listeria monocytogenes EGD-e]EAF3059616.1 DUF1642 domain-containing protein [Listeria monocytogenes serotype 1/2a]AEO04404.1 gp51 [Listeria monocytogenes J0161]EAA0298288.1 DUF1642 domain-containing protein [Listeria monocytogenes]EAA0369079.1 DUF1642 domain-containing protein [Listeria monocytogenes]EAA0417388.1 DUF1642 domain-containing protein [Listeria monocytogenes]